MEDATNQNGSEKPSNGTVPPEIGVVELARSLSSMSSLREKDVVTLSRLNSANHDLILPTKPASRNFLVIFWLWWWSWALPGMGMFSEAYIVFSVGNIKPLLAVMYPNCFGKAEPKNCDQTAESQIATLEIAGIMFGMLSIGFMADWMGRKWGSRLTMSIMLIGSIFLCAMDGPADVFLALYITGLIIYGIGVGGEYPLASSSAAERAEGNPEMRNRRGETVVLTFTQQGWGNWTNTLVILILLAIVGATSTVTPYQAQWVVRGQFIIGAVTCLCVTIYRWMYLEESKVWQAERQGVDEELVYEGKEHSQSILYWVIFKKYWPRLFITSFAWILNDLAFYGNKLFQSTFIKVISGPDASVFTNIEWTLVNSSVALAGYFTAALLIDKKWYGRRRMQNVGFIVMGILFLICGVAYNQLLNNIQVFQFLYFMSSYFNQFGANCTTWLVAGEVFPTDVRAFFHGISAAFGKAGAIAATAIFSQVSPQDTFYISAASGLAGFIFTWIFLPDTTGLDIAEIDRFNRYLVAGQAHMYHGEAMNPRYLSPFERLLGWAKSYNPHDDLEQKKLQKMSFNPNLLPVEEEDSQ